MKNLKVTMAALLAGGLVAVPGLVQADGVLSQFETCYVREAVVDTVHNNAQGASYIPATDDFDDVDEMEDRPQGGENLLTRAYSLGVHGAVIGSFGNSFSLVGDVGDFPLNQRSDKIGEHGRIHLHEVGARREVVEVEIGAFTAPNTFTPAPNSQPVETIPTFSEFISVSIEMRDFFPIGQYPADADNVQINAVRIVDINKDSNVDPGNDPDLDETAPGSEVARGADIDAVGLDCTEVPVDKAITLNSMKVSAEDGKNVVTFETGMEDNTAGMQLLRIHVSDVVAVGEPVESKGNPMSGAEYRIEDEGVVPGEAYIYFVQETDNEGKVTIYPENSIDLELVTAK
jgi:hypothetical protein